jgi:hypothetical protein
MVIVPSSAVDTMNLGGLMGMTSMAEVAEKYGGDQDKADHGKTT